MMRSRIGSQSLLRAKLSSVIKKMSDVLRAVFTNDCLDVVRRTLARLATLDVDDCAERALKRASPSSVEACPMSNRAIYSGPRHQRRRSYLDGRQVVHVIVHW